MEAKKSFIINALYIGIILALCFFASGIILRFFYPFIIGFLLSAAVNKPAGKIADVIKLKTGIIRIILVVLIFVFIIALGGIFLNGIINYFTSFIGELPSALKGFNSVLEKVYGSIKQNALALSQENLNTVKNMMLSALNAVASRLTSFFSSSAAGAARKTPAFFAGSIVTVAASCYIAKDYEKLCDFIKRIMPQSKLPFIFKIKDILIKSVLKYAKGYLILMLLTFSELSISLLFLRVKYAIIVAAVIALVDLLPILGTGTVLIPWGIYKIFSGNLFFGISLFLIYLIITVIRNIAEPKIIGKQMGINPLFTLVFIFVGLKLFGVIGMIVLPMVFIVTVEYYKDKKT